MMYERARPIPLVLSTILTLCLPAAAQAAHSQRYVSAGTSSNLGQVYGSASVGYPAASDQGAIVGMGIASTDRVYVWYADGRVSSGTSQNFQYHSGLADYVLPDGKNPWDIIAMAIAGSNNHVYTWYSDGTVSEGWSRDLGAYGSPQSFLPLPGGRQVSDLVGIGIAGSNDHVYAWYSDGTVSRGRSTDLAYHAAPYAYSVPNGRKIGHIIDLGIAGSNDRVYAWYHDVELGSAHGAIADSIDAAAMDVLRRWRLPGLGVSVSKNGRVVAEKGYGFGNFSTGTRMQDDMRCRIGSVGKIITTLSAFHLSQSPTFDVKDHVYGTNGILSHIQYTEGYEQGIDRHQPIVAKAIAPSDHVYTWYHNGSVSEGTSVDPDAYRAPYAYSLAPNMAVEDIRAIGIQPNSRVFVWYDDGTYSVGTTSNLDRYVERDSKVKVSIPSDYNVMNIVGADFASDGKAYVWYDDGRRSVGTSTDLDAHGAPQSYTTSPGTSPYYISGIGIAKSNSRVYTFFSQGTFVRGWSRDLDSHGGGFGYDIPSVAFDLSKDWHTYYQDMRVDHLLSHSSGLSRSGDVVGAERMFSLPEDYLGYNLVNEYILRTRKLLFGPGEGESYSNHGMGLVGHIVHEVSGVPFKSYARNNIIDPLGLNIRAGSGGQQSIDMYRHSYVNELPAAYIDDPTNDLGLAAGGWKSSAGDLVRLMLATDRKSNHPDLMSSARLDVMESKPYPVYSQRAHGWSRDSQGKLAHNGGLGGGTTYAAKYPAGYLDPTSREITVAICTNVSISDNRGGSDPLRRLANAVAAMVEEGVISGSYDLY